MSKFRIDTAIIYYTNHDGTVAGAACISNIKENNCSATLTTVIDKNTKSAELFYSLLFMFYDIYSKIYNVLISRVFAERHKH